MVSWLRLMAVGAGYSECNMCHGNHSHDDRDIDFPICKDWTLTVPDSGLLLVRLLDIAQAVNVAFLWILAQKGSNDNK